MRKNILILTVISAVVMVNSQNIVDDADIDVATIEPETLSAKSSSEPSFSKSKRILATKIYSQHQKTFYGGCDYEIADNRLVPIHDSCGFHYRKNLKRASRIEWEHIVPAWFFGHNLDCWKRGGRAECRRVSPEFKRMEADMHNLAPAIGEINGDRSNFPYGNIRGERREYGRVDMEIDFSQKLAEPKRNILGDIARVYLYMRDRYGLKLSHEDEQRFIEWNNRDPVTRWERKKNLLVKEYQGDDNIYISQYRKIDELRPIPTEGGGEESFSDVKRDLEERFKPLFELLPKPIATILLFIIAIIIFFRKRK